MDRHPWEIEFYERDTGRCPATEFIQDLSKKDQVLITKAVERLGQYGPDLRRPYVDHLDGDIWELRVRVPSGHVRMLYFFFDGRKIVITHGLVKKQGPVPRSEIERAVAYRSEYLARESKRQH